MAQSQGRAQGARKRTRLAAWAAVGSAWTAPELSRTARDSALSGLEMHAGEGLSPSVREWTEAHAARKAKGYVISF